MHPKPSKKLKCSLQLQETDWHIEQLNGFLVVFSASSWSRLQGGMEGSFLGLTSVGVKELLSTRPLCKSTWTLCKNSHWKPLRNQVCKGWALCIVRCLWGIWARLSFLNGQFFSSKKGNLWQNISIWPFRAAQMWKFATQKKKNSLLITLSTRVFLSSLMILKIWQFFSKKLGRIYTRNFF